MKTLQPFASVLVLALLMIMPGQAMGVRIPPDEALHPEALQSGQVASPVTTASQNVAVNVIQAASCFQNDVQTAINAANEGDFVLIPEGSCAWTTLAAQTPSVIMDEKSITLQGAGIGKTIITDGTGLNWNEVPLRIDGVEGKSFRVTGFSIIGQGSGHYDSFAAITIGGTSKNLRVDHIRFDNIAGRSISVSGHTYGVIDHCEFIQPNGQGVIVLDDRGTPPGSIAWDEPMSFGTADAVFIEDSTFQWGSGADGAIDCGNGGRFVFRHNTIAGIMVGNHGMDSKPRSCMQMEIYDNTFTPSAHSVWLAIQSRGGAALVFNNTINGSYGAGMGVTNYRSCCYAGAACTPSPDPPFGTCDGTSPLDGNTPPTTTYKGWPCKDQIGRGSRQSSEPLYEWNNTLNGSDVDVTVYNNWAGCVNPQPSDHIKEKRDYYNDTPKPGYTPYIYPHPLTKDLVLSGAPADRAIYLNWQVRTVLSPTSTWRIEHYSQTVASTVVATNSLTNTARAFTLTGLTNYAWYTVTLSAMLENTPVMSDTVRVMPTDRFVYLPLVLR